MEGTTTSRQSSVDRERERERESEREGESERLCRLAYHSHRRIALLGVHLLTASVLSVSVRGL